MPHASRIAPEQALTRLRGVPAKGYDPDMSFLDHAIIGQRYFPARRDPLPHPTWVEVDDARLACYSSGQKHAVTVVHFHGNGEVVADYLPFFADCFEAAGADSFFAEYRGYGASTGRPQLARMLDDIPAIMDAVGRPASEIIVFGRSVGSIYAVEFAARFPDIAGLILESGIADVAERIALRVSPAELGVDADTFTRALRARFDHAAKLKGRSLPTLVMHARHDHLVDVSHGERLASYPRENARLVVFPTGNHNTIFGANSQRYLEEVGDLIATCSAGPS
jgi:pimeloyl-ACP methyl ester carboxylesterase